MRPLRNIVISQGTNSVRLRNDLVFEIEYEEVGKIKTMASGKLKKEIIGFRPVLNIPAGYVNLRDLQRLKDMILSGQFLSVTYPGVHGDETGLFHIAPPVFKSFKYDENGVDVWYGVTLVCRAQEVI